jgi:hypothetical protein
VLGIFERFRGNPLFDDDATAHEDDAIGRLTEPEITRSVSPCWSISGLVTEANSA